MTDDDDTCPWCDDDCGGACAADIEAQPPAFVCAPGSRFAASALRNAR